MARPKNNRRSSNPGEHAQRKMTNALDALSDFEQFKEEILPLLRADLKNKVPYKDMRKKYLALLTVRKISIGLAEPDSAKALAAIKDILDREDGKATEHRVVEHNLKNIPDEELDAVLQSEIEDLKDSLTTH